MFSLPHYQLLEPIYQSGKVTVYRGLRKTDSLPVIIKVLSSQMADAMHIAQLQREYSLLQGLTLNGVIQVYDLQQYQGLWILIMEDIQGKSLKEILAHRSLNLAETLDIGIQLATALEELHALSIIHKDLKPANIIVNEYTGQTKLTDFSIASAGLNLSTQDRLAGTLAYMSPEQTGRMNRSIDYRTDFYSLGIVFYEILTGAPPFQEQLNSNKEGPVDTIQLMHQHIAKTPISPVKKNPQVPKMISHIIMKLLEKMADNRYQSATGLRKDLERCRHQLPGEIEEFTCGQYDLKQQFQLSQKLYGRDKELTQLLEKIHSLCPGPSPLIWVTGEMGIGKTTLIKELKKPLLQKRGYFMTGRCELLEQTHPYVPLLQAIQDLLQQMLTANPRQIQLWQSTLQTDLADYLPQLIPNFPELALLLEQNDNSDLKVETEITLDVPSILASSGVLPHLLQTLFGLLKDHQLLLFLDDLHWADPSTLKILNNLVNLPNPSYSLLMIVTYHDEGTEPHLLLKELQQSVAEIYALPPLSLVNLHQLLIDSFHCQSSRALGLANLILQKTDGNCLFVHEFLKKLYHDQHLRFDPQQNNWIWDEQAIQHCGITDNVAQLLLKHFEELPLDTQHTLKLAVCLGSHFNLQTLVQITHVSLEHLLATLQPALILQLCLRIAEDYQHLNQQTIGMDNAYYQFSHPQLQQTIYANLSSLERETFHSQIAQHFLQQDLNLEGNLFEAVNHANQALALFNAQEQQHLSILNLQAGQLAKKTGAHEVAAHHFSQALLLLPANSWEQNYELTLTVYKENLELAYLTQQFATQSPKLISEIQDHSREVIDRAIIPELQILYHISQNQYSRAIDVAWTGLQELGISLIPKGTEFDFMQMAQLPLLTEPRIAAGLKLLLSVGAAIYISDPQRFPIIVTTMLELSKQYGNSPMAIYGYMGYGSLLGLQGDIDGAYQAGELGLQLMRELKADHFKPMAYFVFNTHISIWRQPLKNTLVPLKQAIDYGIEYGQFNFAAYAIMLYNDHLLATGETIGQTLLHCQQALKLAEKLQQPLVSHYLSIGQQALLNLQGGGRKTDVLFGDLEQEENWRTQLLAARDSLSIFKFHRCKSWLSYLFRNFKEALRQGELARYYGSNVGSLQMVEMEFYWALSQLAQDNPQLSQLKVTLGKLQKWAQHVPENYQVKYDLVCAEFARVKGEVTVAMRLYEQAIEQAWQQGFLQEAALANELAGEFYLQLGHPKIAKIYLTEAYIAYNNWGALAKGHALRLRHPTLLMSLAVVSPTSFQTLTATTLTIDNNPDINSLMKATQAISSEIVLEQLVNKFMHIVLENVGAEQGWLILKKKTLTTETTANSTVASESVQDQQLFAKAFATLEKVQLFESTPLEQLADQLSKSIIHYVARTNAPLVLHDAQKNHLFSHDPYIIQQQPKSILGFPIGKKNQLIGVLYLENNLLSHAFSNDRLTLLKLLSTQIAVSLENSLLYTEKEQAHFQAEQARRTAELASRTAEAANRAKSLFLANMSHELRTPLNAILGYCDMLQEVAIEEEYHSLLPDLEKIQVAGKQLLAIISDILDISKIEADRLQLILSEFSIAELVDEVTSIIGPLIKLADNHLVLDISPFLESLYADRPKVTQILLNLLNNATKFTQHGSITLRIFQKIGRADKGMTDTVIFQVIDTGIGIPPEKMNDIFKPFVQVDNSSTRRYGGTGLGLTISEQFCKIMGGNLTLTSELGRGSIFSVQLPRVVNSVNKVL